MTVEGWRDVIQQAFGDPARAALLAQLLAEQDHAKDRLRAMGFGVTGTPWRNVVEEIASWAWRPHRWPCPNCGATPPPEGKAD